jgi:HTH-type transcriptional regulator/antitoxin HigA
MALGSNSHDVIRFARKLHIAPGIVVGQLQHYGRVKRSHLNGLKRRFVWA